ncbi:hypothetical protein YC2023_043552 [Brassica napus]
MVHFTSRLIVFIIVLSFSSSVVLSSATPALVLKLIHPNQIYSQKHAHAERASVARLDYLQAMARGDILAHIYPNAPPAYLVNVSIGSPPVNQLLHMDTASGLSWLQCRPCTNCYSQNIPIFDPSKSITYRKEFCEPSDDIPKLTFDAKTRTCRYSIKYVDDTGSRGTLASETLTFSAIYGESSHSSSLRDVVFGCGHDNYGEPQQGTGVLGLGYGKYSLLHRFGSKFSYCLGSLDDPSYHYNVFVIGDLGADMGEPTSLEIENGMYYVGVEGISVDGTILPIEPWVFQRNYQSNSSGTIIDTGTSLTMLATEAYEPLKEHIDDIFDGRFEPQQRRTTGNAVRTCYNGNFEQDILESGFPTVRIHFTGAGELSLDAKSLFTKLSPTKFCLNVIRTPTGRLNVIGASAQQNHNIGFDLGAHTISFERLDCEILFDDRSKFNVHHHH